MLLRCENNEGGALKLNPHKERICNLLKKIKEVQANQNLNLVIVGPSDRNRYHFRVYSNGGFILKIPVYPQGKFKALEEEYVKGLKFLKKKDEEDKLYIIREKIDGNTFRKTLDFFEEEEYKNLKEYLSLATKATNEKFVQGNNEDNEENRKERNWQTEIINDKIKTKCNQKDIIIFDMEFQTKKSENQGGEIGKPDFIGFDGELFYLIELKTNIEACTGDSGLVVHEGDMKKVIGYKAGKKALIDELLHRIKLLQDFNLIDQSWNQAIIKFDEEGKDNLDYLFLFLINGEYTKERYKGIIDNERISSEKVLFLKKQNNSFLYERRECF